MSASRRTSGFRTPAPDRRALGSGVPLVLLAGWPLLAERRNERDRLRPAEPQDTYADIQVDFARPRNARTRNVCLT
jgi:hypothetical protein